MVLNAPIDHARKIRSIMLKIEKLEKSMNRAHCDLKNALILAAQDAADFGVITRIQSESLTGKATK